MSPTTVHLLIAVLAIAIAFFTSAWVNAVSRLTKARALQLQIEHPKQGGLLVQIAENPRPYLTSTLLVMLAGRATATVLIAAVMLRAGIPMAEVLAIALVIFILFQLAEVAPRTWVLERPDQVMRLSARPVWWLGKTLAPLASFLVRINRLFLLILPGRGLPRGPVTSEEEIKGILDVAESEEVIEAEEVKMIHSIFEFGDTVVREVMVPRPDMVWADADSTLEDLLDLALKNGFSRIPVVAGSIDNVVGIAHAKDVMTRIRNEGRRSQKASDVVRDAMFVPESKKVIELLREMRATKNHMAIVVDEYGGTAGLITMEDLLEQIVGEISDEYDLEEPAVETITPDTLRVTGRTSIEDLNELLKASLPNEQWDSVGGLVGGMLGRVANEGDRVELEGISFEVERTKGRRIDKVLVHYHPSPPEEGQQQGD